MKKLVKTKVDELYDLIIKRKKITMTEISVEMNLEKKLVEEWAKVLAEDKRIRLVYPSNIMQDPYLEAVEELTEAPTTKAHENLFDVLRKGLGGFEKEQEEKTKHKKETKPKEDLAKKMKEEEKTKAKAANKKAKGSKQLENLDYQIAENKPKKKHKKKKSKPKKDTPKGE